MIDQPKWTDPDTKGEAHLPKGSGASVGWMLLIAAIPGLLLLAGVLMWLGG